MSLELSPEDGALISLSTLGLDCLYLWPDKILHTNTQKSEPAARSFDKALLDGLVDKDLAIRPLPGAYRLSREGEVRVRDVLLGNASGPIDMLSGMVRFGFSVGIHWTGERFRVIVMSGTPYVAEDEDLGKAIEQVKAIVDQTQLGS